VAPNDNLDLSLLYIKASSQAEAKGVTTDIELVCKVSYSGYNSFAITTPPSGVLPNMTGV
jgi:hypothetical protein